MKLAPQPPSGVGLTRARGRRPVEDRPPTRFIAVYAIAPLIISVLVRLAASLSLSGALSCHMPPLSSPVQGEALTREFVFSNGYSESSLILSVTRCSITFSICILKQ